MALASDIFTDVGDANPFHDDIGAVFRAGYHCRARHAFHRATPPTYCPSEGITREAMAAFVHRGFGRVDGDSSHGGPGACRLRPTSTPADASRSTAAVAGETQFVKLLRHFRRAYIASADGLSLQHQAAYRPGRRVATSLNSTYNTNITPAPRAASTCKRAAVTTAVAAFLAGTTQTFRLKAVRFVSATGAVLGFGDVHRRDVSVRQHRHATCSAATPHRAGPDRRQCASSRSRQWREEDRLPPVSPSEEHQLRVARVTPGLLAQASMCPGRPLSVGRGRGAQPRCVRSRRRRASRSGRRRLRRDRARRRRAAPPR